MTDGTHQCCGRSWIDGCACPTPPMTTNSKDAPDMRAALQSPFDLTEFFERERAFHCFACGGAIGTVTCNCSGHTLSRGALASALEWARRDALASTTPPSDHIASPSGEVPVKRFTYPDGVPGTPEYEPGGRAYTTPSPVQPAASPEGEGGQREVAIRECAEKANEAYRTYNEPTDWDYGAQDACTKIERAILGLLAHPVEAEGGVK